MPKDEFACKCGQTFPTLEAMQAHWEDPERDRTRPHYRLTPDSMYEAGAKRMKPEYHKDGPQ